MMQCKKTLCFVMILSLLVVMMGCSGQKPSSSQINTVPQSTYMAYDGAKYGNIPSNALNGGLFVEKNGKLFYANPEDGDCLYVYDRTADTHTKLTDTKVSGLNADEQYLYCLMGVEKMITRLKQDGTEITQLYGVENNRDLLLYDGTLYFLDENRNIHLYRLDNGIESILLPIAVSNLTVYEGTVYFLDEEKYLCEGKADGSYVRAKNVQMNSFIINNDWVYFTDAENNYPGKLELHGTTGVYFIDVAASQLTLTADQNLFFRNLSDDKLNSYNINGGDYKVISGDSCDGLSYIGTQLFYRDSRIMDAIRVLDAGAELPVDFME